MNEFQRIDAYLKPLAARQPGALGLTDDAAVLAPPQGREIVVCADAMVENVHFLPGMAPEKLAAKLLRVNLSDLAAMGAEPWAYLTTLALPARLGEGWLQRFASGLGADQDRWPVDLIGGDCVSTSGPISVSLTALGLLEPGKALRRNGARQGDHLFVSGTVGDGILGLMALKGELADIPDQPRQAVANRYECPDPRVELGPGLAGLATACIDVSDGLGADAGHIADESGLGVEIQAGDVPLSAAARAILEQRPDLAGKVLAGGDDYELCFTAPPDGGEVLADLSRRTGVPVTRIGRMVERPADGEPVRYLDREGQPVAVGEGWRHY